MSNESGTASSRWRRDDWKPCRRKRTKMKKLEGENVGIKQHFCEIKDRERRAFHQHWCWEPVQGWVSEKHIKSLEWLWQPEQAGRAAAHSDLPFYLHSQVLSQVCYQTENKPRVSGILKKEPSINWTEAFKMISTHLQQQRLLKKNQKRVQPLQV